MCYVKRMKVRESGYELHGVAVGFFRIQSSCLVHYCAKVDV